MSDSRKDGASPKPSPTPNDEAVGRRLEALAREYRPSMPAEVLHLWAADVVSSLRSQPPAAQDTASGWVLVPREPTDEMIAAFYDSGAWTVRAVWKVLLSAAPPQEGLAPTDLARSDVGRDGEGVGS